MKRVRTIKDYDDSDEDDQDFEQADSDDEPLAPKPKRRTLVKRKERDQSETTEEELRQIIGKTELDLLQYDKVKLVNYVLTLSRVIIERTKLKPLTASEAPIDDKDLEKHVERCKELMVDSIRKQMIWKVGFQLLLVEFKTYTNGTLYLKPACKEDEAKFSITTSLAHQYVLSTLLDLPQGTTFKTKKMKVKDFEKALGGSILETV